MRQASRDRRCRDPHHVLDSRGSRARLPYFSSAVRTRRFKLQIQNVVPHRTAEQELDGEETDPLGPLLPIPIPGIEPTLHQDFTHLTRKSEESIPIGGLIEDAGRSRPPDARASPRRSHRPIRRWDCGGEAAAVRSGNSCWFTSLERDLENAAPEANWEPRVEGAIRAFPNNTSICSSLIGRSASVYGTEFRRNNPDKHLEKKIRFTESTPEPLWNAQCSI